MPLVAVMSDLHQHHWDVPPLRGRIMQQVLDSVREHKPDVVLDAGDWERHDIHNVLRREGFPVVATWGNHDYYGKVWPGPCNEGDLVRVEGIPIIRAPLWTDFNKDDPLTHIIVRESLIDAAHIHGYTTQKVLEAHYQQRSYINLVAMDNPGAVILTHHAPSWKSVHEMYQRDPASWGFVSDMDEEVERSRAKLWVHGHVHTPFDYMIGETRVLCNPCGYPFERQHAPYEPVYVEV